MSRLRALETFALPVLILALTATFAWALEAHELVSSGSVAWRWPFRSVNFAHLVRAFLAPTILVVVAHAIRVGRLRLAIGLLTFAFAWVELAMVGFDRNEFSLTRIERLIQSPIATSYWNAALDLVRDRENWLASWENRMPHWALHARNKPPGPVLFYVVMHQLAGLRGSFLGGLAICGLAALNVPLTFRAARAIGHDIHAAFHAATLTALSPGMLLIAPEFDQVYPTLTLAVFASWMLALDRNSLVLAAISGACLMAATFFAFHLAVLGLPLAVVSISTLVRRRRSLKEGFRLAASALLAFAAGYALLAVVFHYDPIAVLAQARADMPLMTAYADRPLYVSFWSDLADFVRGIGLAAALLAPAALLARGVGIPMQETALAGIALCIVLAAARLLPTETARTWIFLQPLFIVPAGAFLSRRPSGARLLVYASALIQVTFTARNLLFIDA